ncbi:hypothetical protein ACHAWU_004947 [Discostella pseudostelligera]|uniref:Uncharacterized protein n=1 Tax=Discostella pseudostelligera TaxID=259834 RepID=A0ABD3MNM2_9STRA
MRCLGIMVLYTCCTIQGVEINKILHLESCLGQIGNQHSRIASVVKPSKEELFQQKCLGASTIPP